MSDDRFRVMKLNLEHLKMAEDTDDIVSTIAGQITEKLGLRNIRISRCYKYVAPMGLGSELPLNPL